MARDTKLSGGVTPSGPTSDFDRFNIAGNIGKAVIDIPSGDGSVNPITTGAGGVTPTPANVLELPAGITPQQAAQLHAAFQQIVSGQPVAIELKGSPMIGQPPPVRDVIVPDTQMRMWNPMVPFTPQAKLSDMERSLSVGAQNPSAIVAGAKIEAKLKPKEGCSPVLIDCYQLLHNLVVGRWFLPGARTGDIDTMLIRLKAEIETM